MTLARRADWGTLAVANPIFSAGDDPTRDERRMTSRVAREWISMKRGRAFPSINHLNPATFPVIWDWCALVRSEPGDAAPNADALEFEFVGDKFLADAPSCAAGTRLGAVPVPSCLSVATGPMPTMFALGTAVIAVGSRGWRERGVLRFRVIALPFGDSAGRLTYGFGAFSHMIAATEPSDGHEATEIHAFRDGAWVAISPRAM